MELNAKISSLEDEVKLLKGEVKLILSEIRTAVLGQNNPFESGHGLAADPQPSAVRPAIRVVKVPPEDEAEEIGAAASVAPPWDEDEEPLEEAAAEPEAKAPAQEEYEPPPPPKAAEKKRAESPKPPAPLRNEAPASARREASIAEPPPTAGSEALMAERAPVWSLIKVAGLMVWAEEALKQVGPERLQTLLDLCEFAGYLPSSAKEALMRVMSLGIIIDERADTPTVNECLVILYQLHALMQGEEPEVLRGRLSAKK